MGGRGRRHPVAAATSQIGSGPDIVGWSWDAVDAEEAANGTTWGSYRVVGTYTDAVFSLTDPATAPDPLLADDGFEVDFQLAL